MRREGVSGRTKDDNPCSCHETDELLIALIVIKELESFFFCKGKTRYVIDKKYTVSMTKICSGII